MAINTINATIQMRHGLEQDFDADQMTEGEWAVSTDKKYVRMCFLPGIVVRMATYEGFEEDMKEIQIILATCQNIQIAVDAMANLAEQYKNSAQTYAKQAQSYAVGTGGARPNEASDNAKKYYEQSKAIYDNFSQAGEVTGVKGNGESTYRHGNVNITPENLGLGNVPNVSTNDQTPTFTQATTRSNIASGEKVSTIFGKIMKWLSDLTNGAASSLLGTNLTANRALVANESGKVAVSSVTSTELGHLEGSKSKLQDQLDALNTDKLDKAGGNINGNLTATGTISAGENVKIFSNSEGGNIRIISPTGVIWEFDAFNDNLRVFNYEGENSKNINAMVMDKNGDITIPQKLSAGLINHLGYKSNMFGNLAYNHATTFDFYGGVYAYELVGTIILKFDGKVTQRYNNSSTLFEIGLDLTYILSELELSSGLTIKNSSVLFFTQDGSLDTHGLGYKGALTKRTVGSKTVLCPGRYYTIDGNFGSWPASDAVFSPGEIWTGEIVLG